MHFKIYHKQTPRWKTGLESAREAARTALVQYIDANRYELIFFDRAAGGTRFVPYSVPSTIFYLSTQCKYYRQTIDRFS